MDVVGFICGGWAHSGVPLGSLDSLVCALEFVRYIRSRWVHLGSPWVSLDSSVAVGLTRVRPGDIWFIRGRLVNSGSPWWSLGSSGVVWVHLGLPLG